MPATIGDILKTKPELITTTLDAQLHDVLELMIRYDYSQLPILDADGRPIGIVTSDGMLRALHHFGVVVRQPKKSDGAGQISRLRVVDAMERQIQICKPDAEVFTVHRQLRDSSCVLVVDAKGLLKGIITGFDTTEYLRQRVQDIVFVQDIEDKLKDYVRLAFRGSDGTVDETALGAAVADTTPSNSDLSGAFKQALAEYLKLRGDTKTTIDGPKADQAFQAKLYRREQTKAFENLTLSVYITLFLKHGLKRYGQVFPLDAESIATMLDSVRETRNDLAHLRIDITARQRDELRLCREWLDHYYNLARAHVLPALTDPAEAPALAQPLAVQISDTSADLTADAGEPTLNGQAPSPSDSANTQKLIDEVSAPDDSPYAALEQYLFSLPERLNQAPITFKEIERLIGAELPQSAREYRSWWGNDVTRQPQAAHWLNAGWRVDEVDRERGRVTFTRITHRERSYAEFFDLLYQELKGETTFSIFPPSQVGYHWQTIARVPDAKPGEAAGSITFSFTRNRKPRVDLYIDTGYQQRNKEIFEALLMRREEIETAFGGSLEWERMPEKRASRIAVYYDHLIDIGAELFELKALRAWGVQMLIRLKRALDEPARQVMEAHLAQKNSKAATPSR